MGKIERNEEERKRGREEEREGSRELVVLMRGMISGGGRRFELKIGVRDGWVVQV